MAAPRFGLQFIRVTDEARPVIGANLSVIELIGPSEDADPDTFPLNTPVRLNSNELSKLVDLGEDGYLSDAIRGINDQLGDLQRAVQIVVLRTPIGTNANAALKAQETIAGIMGSSTSKTGLWAFTKAPELVGVTPRIIIAPGYTSQRANGVASVLVGTVGTMYTPGATYTVTFSGGGAGATVVQATGHAVANDEGEITSDDIVIDTPGQWYTTPPTVAIEASPDDPTVGVDALATATIDQLGNPVVAGLSGVLSQLLAHAIVESAGTSQQSDIDWRETFQSERIIPISGGVKVVDPITGGVITMPAAPRMAGILVRRDFETGAPFHSGANQPVQGIVGPGREMGFSILDNANEAQQLIEANVGVVVRGEIGSDFAIAAGGFVAIFTDNAGEDELWRFYNQTRGRDYIHLSLIPAQRRILGRHNISIQSIQMILNTNEFFLRDLEADGHILGYKNNFVGEQNSPEQLRLGRVTVDFAAEEPAPIMRITNRSARYRPALEQLVANLEASLNLAA